MKYGTICEFGCKRGYQLSGPLKSKCMDQGFWSEGHQNSRCIGASLVLMTEFLEILWNVER